MTDWLPTLYSAAKGNLKGVPEDKGRSRLSPLYHWLILDLPSDLDGLDQWQSLSSGSESVRKEMLYNINPIYCAFRPVNAAIR